MVLDGAVLCDRCLDRRVAAAKGYPELPESSAPDELSGARWPDPPLSLPTLARADGHHGRGDRDRPGARGGVSRGVLGSHEADRLTWTQFGRALEPFEGWAFRLTFEHTDTLEDGDG